MVFLFLLLLFKCKTKDDPVFKSETDCKCLTGLMSLFIFLSGVSLLICCLKLRSGSWNECSALFGLKALWKDINNKAAMNIVYFYYFHFHEYNHDHSYCFSPAAATICSLKLQMLLFLMSYYLLSLCTDLLHSLDLIDYTYEKCDFQSRTVDIAFLILLASCCSDRSSSRAFASASKIGRLGLCSVAIGLKLDSSAGSV